MITKPVVALAVASFAYAAASAAQTYPGLAFDQTVHQGRDLNTSDDTVSAVLHFTTSRGNIRVEIEGKTPATAGFLGSKHRSIMLLTDTGTKITFINDERKEYFSLNPVASAEAIKKSLEAMGGKIIVDSTHSGLSLDSLGPGPVVDGHPTLHYRLTDSLRVAVVMRGTPSGFEQHSVEDILVAADLTDLPGVTESLAHLLDMGRAMGLAPAFVQQAKAMQGRIHGLPLRVTKVMSVSTNGGRTRTGSQDIVVSNVRRIQVPDSAFAVPAGYSQLTPPRLPAVNQ